MRVPRRIGTLDLLERVKRPKVPVVATPLSGGPEGKEGKEGPAGKEGPKGEQGLTGTGEINCRLATVAALAAYTRSTNVLTANANGALATIDGVAPAINDFILLKNGAAGADNGVYKVTSLGSGSAKWTMERIPSMDTSAECVPGMLVTVAEGTTNADSIWQLTTNGPVTLNTTALAFAKRGGPCGCGVTNSTEQEVKNEVNTPLTWNTEEYDDGGCHDTASNTSRFVVPPGQDGLWTLDASFWWQAAIGTGRRSCYVRVNGNDNQRIAVQDPSQSPAVALNIKVTKRLAAGDYLEIVVWQNSGSTEKIRKDNYGTSFETCRASFERLR